MAGEPREGPIDDQLHIRVHDDPVIPEIEPRGPVSQLGDFSSLGVHCAEEKAAKKDADVGGRMETRRRERERGEDWTDEVYRSPTRFRKSSAYHIIVTLLNTA